MPILFTFDVTGAALTNANYNQVQSLFERFGWERLGGTAYRYPILGTDDQPVEDWFNHVIPALMLFRCFALKEGVEVTRFTLDTQSSTGYSPSTDYGSSILGGPDVTLYTPGNLQFGESRLREWLDDVVFPY